MYWRLGKLVHRRCFSFAKYWGRKKKEKWVLKWNKQWCWVEDQNLQGKKMWATGGILCLKYSFSFLSTSCLCTEFLFCRTGHWMCQAGDGRAMIRDKKFHWKVSQRRPTIWLICCSQPEVPLTSKRSHYFWFTHLFILHSRFFDMCQILPKV